MDVNKKLIDEHSFKKIRANYLKKLGLTSNYFYVCTYFCLVFLPQPRQVCELVQLTFKSNSSYSINALFCEQKIFRQTWHLQTRSASRARTSTIFPLPSSPHCPPRTTDTHGLVILRLQVSFFHNELQTHPALQTAAQSSVYSRGKGFIWHFGWDLRGRTGCTWTYAPKYQPHSQRGFFKISLIWRETITCSMRFYVVSQNLRKIEYRILRSWPFWSAARRRIIKWVIPLRKPFPHRLWFFIFYRNRVKHTSRKFSNSGFYALAFFVAVVSIRIFFCRAGYFRQLPGRVRFNFIFCL